jgi:transcriptional regulator with XRE-family HTH domain
VTNFSERLRRAADHAGVGETQSEIAADLGLSKQTVHHWFRGLNGGAPEAENLALIAKRWGVDHEWLRTGEGEMLPKLNGTDPLPDDELELLRDYRRAPAERRPQIRAVVRTLRKAILTIAACIPPLLAHNDTDAQTLHKTICEPNRGVILIACMLLLFLRRCLSGNPANPCSRSIAAESV